VAQGARYVGRGGEKLKFAIVRLRLDVRGMVGADFGCSIGGFTDCLLQEGVARVYAVDTGYGMLAWKLRQDERVVVMERTNAMHVELPQRVGVLTVDVGWTRQCHILPNALAQCAPDGIVLSLFKPQYEAPPQLVRRGRIREDAFDVVLAGTLAELAEMGVAVSEVVRLPQVRKRKNPEAILYIRAAECGAEGRRDA
jgi:23S rRNA (cytidine1920-2'-O)/16S rRNA (cytidine1409-2'-O)-methyltransferase